MIDFTLTDDQAAIRAQAREFAEKEIRPVAWEYDESGEMPLDVMKKAWDIGLMNTHVPERFGGLAIDFLTGTILEEELAWGCSGMATSINCNGLATIPVQLAGKEEVQKELFEHLTSEFVLASFGLTEPGAGSDVASMRTSAKRVGDKYVINGSKCFITNAGYSEYFTVFAKTDPEAGHRGVSAFLVKKDDSITIDKKEDKMGQRASNTGTVTFNDTEVDAKYLLGEENGGFKVAMGTLDRTRPGVAAMATGISQAAFDMAKAYSLERIQFGVPIAMHQAIQFLLADMATKIEASRLLTWQSAKVLDDGKRNSLVSSHAKRFASDSAMEITTDAVQVHGGYGYIKEYKVEKFMRDAKLMQLYEGTSQIQRMVIAKDILLGRG
jgi:acyl-CoA dehydrogenase